MALQLNEQHIEILTEVREKLRERMEIEHSATRECDEYICVQILWYLGRQNGIEKAIGARDLPEAAQTVFYELTNAIEKSMGYSATVGMYLDRLKIRVVSIERKFSYLAPLARLAWLDRMIETKVLA